MKWISVKDCLPKPLDQETCLRVLAIDKDGYFDVLGYTDLFGWDNFDGDQITHWMPLPSLPEKDE